MHSSKRMYTSNNILLIVQRSNIQIVICVAHDLFFKISYIEIMRSLTTARMSDKMLYIFQVGRRNGFKLAKFFV